MSIVVTPQPDHVPPRVRIDVDTDDPTKPFTSLTIFRDGKPIREQPYVGGSEAVAFDYEAPFGVPVTYSAVGTTSGYSAVYTTSWANLTGWSTVSGSPGVTGGKFYSTNGTYASASLPIAGLAKGRVTIAPGALSRIGLTIPTAALLYGMEIGISDPAGAYVIYAGTYRTFARGTGTIVATFDEKGVTVSTTAGTLYCPRGTSFEFAGSVLVATATDSAGRIPGITIEQPGTLAPFSATTTTQLDTLEAWLIHPSQPSLSIPIDSGPQGAHRLRFIEASSGESKTSEAQRTIHRGIGSRRAVVITSGPRAADEWTMVLGAPTIVQKNAVRAIVDDQTPLLLRIPPSSEYDLPDDWYSVGDLTVTRLETPNITEETLITLPLTPVDEPIVRQGALWTWGDVMLKYATWADLLADNETWLDVLAGPSS